MRVVIIEDEAMAIRNLTQLLQQFAPDFHIVETLSTVDAAIHWFHEHPAPDLIFLDIHLADGSGFDIFESVTIPAPIIFTTAYDQYALKAFEVNSLDYLLKPIAPERFRKALAKLELQKSALDLASLQKLILTMSVSPSTYKSRFLVKLGSHLKSIDIDDIAYFHKDDIVMLVTRQGHKYPVNFSLDDLERLVNPDRFLRLNRQVIAHAQGISEVQTFFKGKLQVKLKPDSGSAIILSAERATRLKSWLDR
jgi:DNA-binding LytR/AlgR family response regulator